MRHQIVSVMKTLSNAIHTSFMSYFAENSVTTFTLNNGYDCLFMMSSNHRIAFSVTNLRPLFNMGWSFINRSSTNDLAPTFSAASIALFTLFLTAKLFPQASTGSFIGINVAIVRLMANSNSVSDLLRTQFIMEIKHRL